VSESAIEIVNICAVAAMKKQNKPTIQMNMLCASEPEEHVKNAKIYQRNACSPWEANYSWHAISY
jgi:hypothetical protein